MKTLYRLVLLCGALPLVTGIGIFLLWLPTRWEFLESAGGFCLVGGTAVVVVGIMMLAVWWQRPLEDPTLSRARRGWAAAALLLVNVPAAAGVIALVLMVRYPVHKVVLEDVTREQTRTVTSRLRHPHSILIRAVGSLDGQATVMVEDGVWLELKPGPVDVQRGGDWYTSECRIRYVPQAVRSGSLRLEVQFH